MERDCPGCGRKAQDHFAACDFCGYEFHPILIEEAKPRSRVWAALGNGLLGLGILAGAGHFYLDLDYSAVLARLTAPEGGSARQVAAKPKMPDGYHKVERTNRGGPEAFHVYGEVFDLLGLEPVAGATLVFQDAESGKFYGAFSDGQGRYEAWLPAVPQGYRLSAHKDGFAKGFVEDWDPSLRRAELRLRLDMAEDLREKSEEVHVHGEKQARQRRDLVMVPREDYVPDGLDAIN